MDGTESFDEKIKRKILEVEGQLKSLSEEIEDEAIYLANEFKSYRMSVNKQHLRSNKDGLVSELGVITRNHRDMFRIDWVRYRHMIDKNKPIADYIPRGKSSFAYTRYALKKYAQDWEIDYALEKEQKFAQFREAFSIIKKSKSNLKKIKRRFELDPTE